MSLFVFEYSVNVPFVWGIGLLFHIHKSAMSRPTTDADGRAGGKGRRGEGGTAFCHVSVAPLSPNRGYQARGRTGEGEIKKHCATVGYLVFGNTGFLKQFAGYRILGHETVLGVMSKDINSSHTLTE